MRSRSLDLLRALAVIWMIIFHTAYDMKMFQMVDWDFGSGFWYAFPRVIAFTFLYCVGVALNFTHTPSINWGSLKKRSLKLGACALIISLSTYALFPAQWIYFGTLHCILVGSILGALLVNHRKLAALLLALILIAQYGLSYDIKWVSSVLQRPSMDFIPIYPWFWAILLGILTGPTLSKSGEGLPKIGFLRFLSQHSLKIYLLHQPIIFGALWLINRMSHR